MQAIPTQDQLFRRIMVISMLIGILIGIFLTIQGLSLGTSLAEHQGASLLTKLLADELGYPLFFCMLGAFTLLYGNLRAVRKQLQTLSQSVEMSQAALVPFYIIFGIYLFLYGVLGLLVRIFSVDLPVFLSLLLFPGGLLGSAIALYFKNRSSRRTTWQ